MSLKIAIRAACVALLLGPAPAGADATLLLCDPFGRLAWFSPTGHIAVYLNRVCADSPTRLRPCAPGEAGVVISRYKNVGDLDWIAIPVLPYLYAVERAADVPAVADRETVAALRNAYRARHLGSVVPEGPDGRLPAGNWAQLVGAAYDRGIVAISVRTTAEQDLRLIETLNERPNRSRFSSFVRNCADFARDVLNLSFPGAIGHSAVADFGLTTPKHVARSLARFAERRPDLQLRVVVLPQVAGSLPRSRGTRGVAESLVRKPLYLVPLVVVQPWVPVALAGSYVATSRFNPARHADAVLGPADVESWAPAARLGPGAPPAAPGARDDARRPPDTANR